MTALYVPGVEETDTKKIIRSQQLVASQTSTNTTGIATNTASIATNTTNIASNTSAITALQAGPLVSGSVAAQSDQETATSTTLAVTPGRQQFHPSAAKAWVRFTQSAGTYTQQAAYNIASFSKTSTGLVVVNLTTAFSSANFAVVGSSSGVTFVSLAINSVSQVTVNLLRSSTEASTDANFSLVFYGDQ
jgi:hypothetical protein